MTQATMTLLFVQNPEGGRESRQKVSEEHSGISGPVIQLLKGNMDASFDAVSFRDTF